MTSKENNIKLIRSKPHELLSIIKSLSKQSQKAVATLSRLCESEDEKIALEASKGLLNAIKEMSASSHRDELQLILVKAKIGNGRVSEQEDNTPYVDFENIQAIE